MERDLALMGLTAGVITAVILAGTPGAEELSVEEDIPELMKVAENSPQLIAKVLDGGGKIKKLRYQEYEATINGQTFIINTEGEEPHMYINDGGGHIDIPPGPGATGFDTAVAEHNLNQVESSYLTADNMLPFVEALQIDLRDGEFITARDAEIIKLFVLFMKGDDETAPKERENYERLGIVRKDGTIDNKTLAYFGRAFKIAYSEPGKSLNLQEVKRDDFMKKLIEKYHELRYAGDAKDDLTSDSVELPDEGDE
jgi:hypothetical protein